MNKIGLLLRMYVCLLTLGLVNVANSGQITQLVIQDVGSTLGGAYNTTLDGNSGGFRFTPINPETYVGVTGFSSDTGVPMLWGTLATPLFQGPGVFTTGFLFAGLPAGPFTFGTIDNGTSGAPFNANGAIGDITGNVLTIDSLGWGTRYEGSFDYPLEPDPGSLQVNWLVPSSNPNEYLVSFQWSHLITADEDPMDEALVGFTTYWILEGIATVEPENQPPDCSAAIPSINTLWPPNFMFASANVLNVTDPDGDSATITIDSIFQDEPVDPLGNGRFAPDGSGVGSTTAYVRAERAGNGNGRVYHIGFTADDENGGSCTGTVQVSVPRSQNAEGAAVDDGPLYDSTIP
jgi:hypothetical protein